MPSMTKLRRKAWLKAADVRALLYICKVARKAGKFIAISRTITTTHTLSSSKHLKTRYHERDNQRECR